MAVRVGLKSAVIAPLIKDLGGNETESGLPEVAYGGLIWLPGVQQVDQTATLQSVNVDSDDTTDTIDQCSGYSGTITRDSFSPEEASIVLGEKKVDDFNISTSLDEPGYFAMGYKSMLRGKGANNQHLYMWILKTKFAQSNMTAQSAGIESLTPQADAISFKSVNRDCDGAWRIYIRSNDPNMDSKFFSQETLQKMATAATQVYTSPVGGVEFADTLPDKGIVGHVCIVGGTESYYWNGTEFVKISEKTA